MYISEYGTDFHLWYKKKYAEDFLYSYTEIHRILTEKERSQNDYDFVWNKVYEYHKDRTFSYFKSKRNE